MTASARGTLVFSRVLSDPGAAFALALERSFTGRAVLTSQSGLLLGDDDAATVAFEAGLPTHVRHADGRTGPDAVAALALAGPSLLELYGSERPRPLEDACRVAPTTPATNLADEALVERTRAAAPAESETDERAAADDELAAVTAFLEDEEAVEALQSRAREEAARRAAEWGFETEED